MMYEFFERVMIAFVGLLVIATFGLVGVLAYAEFNTIEGPVVAKYYDDPDLVCGKGCIPVDECWTIKVGNNPWFDNTICYTKSDYDKINVGDYIKEN